MMTRQQMNDYLLQSAEQEIRDEPSLADRIFDSYRAWVLSVIKAGKDQLASKPTSTAKPAEGEQGGGGGPASPAPQGNT